VSRILEKHGVTAKSLSQRVKQPPTREMKPISVERHRAAAKQIARVDNDGRWVIATDVCVRKNDLVRHPVHGEGQAVKVHLRRVLCRFLLLEEHFPLTEIEVFCYTLSREKRQEATKRIWKRFGL
jgi:hypothetical protein